MGIVESCTSREKEDQTNVVKIGLDDFENKGLDFAYGNTFFQKLTSLAKKKELSSEIRMNKLTPYNKEYDYLFADKLPRTHENFKAIQKENDVFQFSKAVQLVTTPKILNSLESYHYFEPALQRTDQNYRRSFKFLQLYIHQKIPCL